MTREEQGGRFEAHGTGTGDGPAEQTRAARLGGASGCKQVATAFKGRSSSGLSGKRRCWGLRDPLSAEPGWARGRLEAEEGNEGVGKCSPGHLPTQQDPSLRTPPGEQGYKGGHPTSTGHLRL